MGLDRRLRDDEFGRYLGVEKPPRDEGEHLGLALGAAAEPAAAGRGPTSTPPDQLTSTEPHLTSFGRSVGSTQRPRLRPVARSRSRADAQPRFCAIRSTNEPSWPVATVTVPLGASAAILG